MAAPEPARKISLEQAISERVGRFSGALRSAMRARAAAELDPVMAEIDQLLRAACILERLVFAKHVLDLRTAPRVLIQRLLTDNYLVALSMQEAGYGLSEDELLALLVTREPAFQQDVASRAGLSERITDFLLASPNDEIRYRVAANRGAALSPRSLAALLQQSENDQRLRQALSTRISGYISAGSRRDDDALPQGGYAGSRATGKIELVPEPSHREAKPHAPRTRAPRGIKAGGLTTKVDVQQPHDKTPVADPASRSAKLFDHH